MYTLKTSGHSELENVCGWVLLCQEGEGTQNHLGSGLSPCRFSGAAGAPQKNVARGKLCHLIGDTWVF